MVKMSDKRKETVSFYRQLLDPMGFTITPKLAPKGKDTSWKPKTEDMKIYNEMDSLKIEKTIQDLKSNIVAMQRDLGDIKQKVIEYMNRQEPTELTKQLYTGTYARSSVLKTGVKLASKAFNEAQSLISYLTALKLVKLKSELIEGLQKQDVSILSAGISREPGEPTLVIDVE